jgi:ArsR family transcriptional regulator
VEKSINIFKALADGNRVRVVMALIKKQELCVCQITALLEITMATVSRHMSVLQNAQLVVSRKEGRWVYYRLADGFPVLIKKWLKENLAEARQISHDLSHLETILSADPEDLCKPPKR